jgi:hypothetical protein
MVNVRFGIVQFETPQAKKRLQLFDVNDFEISASQYPTHLLPCREWLRAEYNGPPEYQTVTCHSL